MNIKTYLATSAFAVTLLTGCGSSGIQLTAVEYSGTIGPKNAELTETQLEHWGHEDLITDTIPGMSVIKAYNDILNAREGKKVIVGVVDSGVDINHEDLSSVIWVNENEIPDNGIDDDKNGYIDDVHGWNFLGESNDENLELTRIVKKGDDGSEQYKNAKADFDKKYREAKMGYDRYSQILEGLTKTDDLLKEHLGKDSYTAEDLAGIESDDAVVNEAAKMAQYWMERAGSIESIKGQLEEGVKYFGDQLEYNLNTDFDGRAIVGDNPEDITDTKYGNNDVIGNLEHALHGTHVAGIIAAVRNNGIGMDGVAKNTEIMVLRAVPNGDEYDKDIALAIRYAVDNGAKVINGSFGKSYSPHKEWVYDALKYAADHDVLFVHAAGNDSYFLDEEVNYPNDQENNGPEFADNVLTVGALNYEVNENLVAPFSNYGKINVDVFAPGTKIYSTVPESKYEYLQGTSMAAPGVAGVAALIRSYFPKLSASEVKNIIMNSGLPYTGEVIVGGDPNNKQPFTDLSKSGKMVNLYNAIILADKVSRGKVNL
ncbi:S8 family peptidase [Robertkochia solimangrovi]|uniref:S8 family peptidase n=1 Tax=Robertkochia solimangrovi TaxID=2213046 RepID=UPI0011806D7A|nr:S8 family peptidase [Robertkochia solimangrovi]TRZ46077.1 peptidase S8 [Robertkochia solimangrovi]